MGRFERCHRRQYGAALTRLIYGVNKLRCPIASGDLTFVFSLGDIYLLTGGPPCKSLLELLKRGSESRTLFLYKISDPRIMDIPEAGVLETFGDLIIFE
jgi:hypothetical protein